MNKFTATAIILALLLAVWALLHYSGLIPSIFMPSPLEVAGSLWTHLATMTGWWSDVFATLGRTLAGFLVGGFIGVVIGLAIGFSKRVYSSLEFFVDFFRSVPAAALFPLFLLFFGLGDVSKIAITAWVSALLVMVGASYGVHHSSKLRMMAARVFRPSKTKIFKDFVMPEAASHIASSLRIALSFSLYTIVFTEMFVGTLSGLGRRIMDAQLVYQTPDMYAAIILAGILGFLLNQAFLIAERRSVHWSGR